jgi:GMP reductase
MNKLLNYRDIALIPRMSMLHSRDEASTSINFLNRLYKMPIVPANMAAVIDNNVAKWLAHNNYFYIMHRFCDVFSFVEIANNEAWPLISISVGVKTNDKELIKKIKESELHVDVITIDIAHGYSILTAEMVSFIKKTLPKVKVIAGNVWGDANSISYLESLGVDAIKIGLSMGKSCRTFPETGFGSPMFSAAFEAGKCANVPVIIDGGVRENGDVAKALVAFLTGQTYCEEDQIKSSLQDYFINGPELNSGIDIPDDSIKLPMIMVGGMLAECLDAPGENIERDDGKLFKKFYGSASAENKKNTCQEVKHVEGQTILLPCNNLTYEQKYREMKGALQSSISYAGGANLYAFKSVKWGTVS